MNYKSFVKRVIDYSKATGIQMLDSGRNLHLKPVGLPDPRGFVPHLRSVLLDQKTFRRFRTEKADFRGEGKWIIHDLLHVMFYDFAFQGIGKEAFEDPARFFEVHLASEAFAVLALDYHILSQEPGEGLAIDFNAKDWPAIQKLCPQLPHYLSAPFVKVITDLYLSGDASALESQKSNKALDEWRGHEIRYTEKQRLYVAQWRSDMDNQDFDGKIPVIENSYIYEAVHELLALIMGDKQQWEDYCRTSAKAVEGIDNYLAKTRKYRSLVKVDYRFTDFRSQSQEEWSQALEKVGKPNASDLFFFWQLAASVNEWSETAMRTFGELQASANSPKINLDLWRVTHETLIKNSKQIEDLPPKPELKLCFFLP